MKLNSKLLGVLALSVFLFAVMMTGVSAFTITANPLTLTGTGSSGVLSVANNGNSPINLSSYTVISPMKDDKGTSYYTLFKIDPLNYQNIASQNSATYNVSLNSQDISAGSFSYGSTYSEKVQFNATNSTDSNSTNVTLNYLKSFCQNGDTNDSNSELQVSIVNENGGDSSWTSLDTIEVEVRFYNGGSQDLSDVMLKLGLFDSQNRNVANNMLWGSSDGESVDLGGVDSGQWSDTYTFKFRVDPSTISNQKSSNYKLMVKAYPQGDENQFCIDHSSDLSSYGSSYFANINMNGESSSSKSVVVDPASVPLSTTAKCRQQVTLTPTLYNIGSSRDYKNQIFVRLYNSELGLNANQTIYGNLNRGSDVQVPFSFTIPLNATEKTYTLSLVTYYGYNENNNGYYVDGNYYQYVSDNIFTIPLTVSGGCVYATPETTQVQAQLQSGGKAGEPLVIQATIANTGSKTVNYNLNLEGYTSWATLSSITPSNITLAPGQSQNVMINMNVNKDATGGNKQFSLDVYSNGYLIKQQPLSLSVTPRFWNSITGGAISGTNVALWGFNIILILAIIIVLVIVIVRRRK